MATTEKMLPAGMMPGRDEIGKYLQLYRDPDFTLKSRITSFDFTSLPDACIAAFCQRYPHYTCVGDEECFGDEPVQYRYRLIELGHSDDMKKLEAAEARFRREGNEKTFGALRKAFSAAIGTRICVDYLKKQCEAFTPEEHKRQMEDHRRREAERFAEYEKRKAREPILREVMEADPYLEDLDYYTDRYHLTEEEVSWLENALENAPVPVYVPAGYTLNDDWRRDMDIIPIMSVKIKMLRKALKLNQREFAKRIGYNINKYAQLERGELGRLGFRNPYEAFPEELIKRIVDATYANPYWLLDESEASIYDLDEDKTAAKWEEASPGLDPYPMFAEAKVIRHWWSRRGIQ